MHPIRNLLAYALVWLLLAAPAAARASIGAGADWLEDQAAADGLVQSRQPLATDFQATAAAVEALDAAGRRGSAIAADARAYLAGRDAVTTARLARRILAVAGSGPIPAATVDELRARQRADGAFGDRPGYTGTVIDTALALRALAAAGVAAGDPDVRAGTGFLLAAQDAAGGWARKPNAAAGYPTALAVRGLHPYRSLAGVRDALDAARAWLLDARGSDGGLGESYRTASALLAIAPTAPSKDVYSDTASALRDAQRADGSWAGDAFTTALAVQALALAGQAQPNPDIATIEGRVVAAGTGLAIDGAAVEVTGTSGRDLARTTGADGGFLFNGLEADTYELTITADGFLAVTTQIALAPGQQADLGRIELIAGSADTGTIRGTISDARSGEPVAGATVALAGSGRDTRSDGDGRYQLTGIAPGPVTLELSADGYAPATVDVDVEAGAVTLVSPELTPASALEVVVAGTVTDNETGDPVAGASISISGADSATATTAADGSYRVEGLDAGSLTLEANAAGFHPATATVDAGDGARLDFSPALQPDDLPPPGDAPAGLTGTIVDSVRGQPIEGATVRVTVGGDTSTATTTAEGVFEFTDLPAGSATVEFSASEHLTRSGGVDLAAGVLADIGRVELTPVDPDADASLVGRAIAAGTGDPVTGAEVTAVLDSGTQSVTADADGGFEITGLPPESATVRVEADGFETATLGVMFRAGRVLDVGDVALTPADAEQISPDLLIEEIDQSGVTIDPGTFEVNGSASVTVANAGNQNVTSGFRIDAYIDADGDGVRDTDAEPLLGTTTVTAGVAASEGTIDRALALAGQAGFRDAPITFVVDAGDSVVELDEDNNTASTAAQCASGAPVVVDLAACLDGSGSIGSSDFQVQLDGVASAIENPAIVPRNGSVRLTVIQFSSFSRVEVAPTRITADNAETLAADIRSIGFRSGGTAIHSCIATARDQLGSATPASAVQVIDVSTDGQSSRSAAEREADAARDAGVDALNAIGIGGGIDRGLLEAIAYPKPVGGDSGFVVEVDDFEQFGDAIADKIQRETSVPDPSVGGLRIVDGGAGAPVTLSAVVGNAGQGQTPDGVELVFYAGDPAAGGARLAGVAVAQLGTGEHERLSVEVDGLGEAERVYATVEGEDGISQCSSDNDTVSRRVATELGVIAVATDRAAYPADATVAVDGTITNTGSLQGRFDSRYAVLDADGTVVARLDRFEDVDVAAGGEVTQATTWPTGATLPGGYSVRARLLSPAGELIDEATAPFTIEATTPGGDPPPDGISDLVTLRTQPDAAQYSVSDTVTLDNLVRNLSVNAIVADAELALEVTDPGGAEVYADTLPLATLQPGGRTEAPAELALEGAPLGDYAVAGTVRAADGEVLASADAGFEVINDLDRAIVGEVTVTPAEVFVTRSVTCTESVTNRSPLAVGGLRLRSIVADLDGDAAVSQSERTVDLGAEVTRQDARGVATTGFDTGFHACILQARVDDEWKTLDSAAFEVQQPPIELSGRFEARERGRLLVLLDAGRTDREQCGTVRRVDLRMPKLALAGADRVELELVDRGGAVVDAEAFAGALDAPVDRSRGTPANLAVRPHGEHGVRLRVADPGDAGSHRVRARLWHGGHVSTLESDWLPPDCRGHGGRDDGHDGHRDNDDGRHGHGKGNRSGGWLGDGPELEIVGVERADDVRRPDPHGPRDAPPLGEQRDYLEALLDDAGWQYRIVESADAFRSELRSGGYAGYALFNERVKLDPVVQKELRAAVYRGGGLVFAGPHDQRNHFVFEAAGAYPRGRAPGADGVAMRAGPLGTADERADLGVARAPLRLCAGEADVAAVYTGHRGGRGHHGDRDHEEDRGHDDDTDRGDDADHRVRTFGGGHGDHDDDRGDDDRGDHDDGHGHGGCSPWSDPVAATTRTFGDGRSVLSGLDLLAEATAAGGGRLEDLLRDGLDWSHGAPVAPAAGSVRGYRVIVTNERFPTPGRVTVSLPDGVEVVSADGADVGAEGGVAWSFDLARDETFERTLWLRLPGEPRQVILDGVVESNYLDPDTFVVRAQFERPIDVAARPGLDDARAAVAARGPWLRGVERKLEHAARWRERGRFGHALRSLTHAADRLDHPHLTDPDAVRRPLAFAIGRTGRLWFERGSGR